uniref:GAR domain-containing protein n=1 Tax=Polyblepharides amylifera TaxID=1486889 RepID=A0A7R9SVP1_9CHLO|mmetsp:Transcript_513/g.727  ORF Transcript_513/g.727 Transcript_513/m.727 type:complete len:190 (+) Transcript_513:211-780(+)
MRRRPGIQGLQKREAEKSKLALLGETVAQRDLEHMRAQLATFKQSLEEFALKHRSAIRQDPAFRAQFHKMCAHVGVDPLASNKGVWASVLGLGDFYFSLGVQVVEVCLAWRPLTGGLMPLTTLTQAVQRRRGSAADPVSEDDVKQAIKHIKVLGGGYRIVNIGNKHMVYSVPMELNKDQNAVLEFAQVM